MVNKKSKAGSPVVGNASAESVSDDNERIEGDDDPGETHPRPVGAASWPIQIVKTERTIFELHRSYKAHKVLKLNPDFQRDFVWDEERKIRLAESVLARIPLPVFYLSEENEDETIVIDGQQRLKSLFDFLDGELTLKDLALTPEYNGKTFSELEQKIQRRFENTPLTCFIVQPGTKPDIKFQIFERLNQGGIVLNAQEIRNCIYRGKGLNLIKELASNNRGPDKKFGPFRTVAGIHRKFSRMAADELVLRAIAFLDLGVDKYPGELKSFLNDEIQRLNSLVDKERESIKQRFLSALERTQMTFGSHAFQRYDNANNTWISHINGPVLELMVLGFDQYFPKDAPFDTRTAELVKQRFMDLCGQQLFRDSITFATQPTKTVKHRIELWRKELADVAQHQH